MVGEGGGESQKDDLQVVDGVGGHAVRGVEQRQQPRQRQQAQPSQSRRHPCVKEAGEIVAPAKGPAVLRPVKLGQQGAHPVTAPADEKEKQIHHRPGHAHRSKGALPHKAAHNHRVHCVVQLLKNITR